MKFLIDASADSRDLRTMLTEQGHDVVTAAEIGPGTPDDVVLARAAREQRVLITEDKDFGELVFIYRMPLAGIVRLTDMSSQQRLEAVRELLEHHSSALGPEQDPRGPGGSEEHEALVQDRRASPGGPGGAVLQPRRVRHRAPRTRF